MIDIIRMVFNFVLNLDFCYCFFKVSQLCIIYCGCSSQFSMENLLLIVDNFNLLNICVGNLGLKFLFVYIMCLFYNIYNVEKQCGIMIYVNFIVIQNSISNSMVYDENMGGIILIFQNINGNWNVFGLFGFNLVLKNKKFIINFFFCVSYWNQVVFLYNKEILYDDKNMIIGLILVENLNGFYWNDWFEFLLNGFIEYIVECSKLCFEKNQNFYIFLYGVSINVILLWQMILFINIINQFCRGYDDVSLNNNELIWNV